MKPETLYELGRLCRAIEQIASLLLPACDSNADRAAVEELRLSAAKSRHALIDELNETKTQNQNPS